MKKIMNLNKRAAIKTKSIIFAIIVLSTIITYAEGQTTAGGSAGQTAEKQDMAQPQPEAASWENGTNTQISTHTQKTMKNPEITGKQSQQVQIKPALPLNQKDAVATQESTEQDTQSILSTGESEKISPTPMNKQDYLVYIGVLLVLLLVVFLFIQGRKAKNKGPGNEKEMKGMAENIKKKD